MRCTSVTHGNMYTTVEPVTQTNTTYYSTADNKVNKELLQQVLIMVPFDEETINHYEYRGLLLYSVLNSSFH